MRPSKVSARVLYDTLAGNPHRAKIGYIGLVNSKIANARFICFSVERRSRG